jgi:peptide/nickel transport system substrate-binding protein
VRPVRPSTSRRSALATASARPTAGVRPARALLAAPALLTALALAACSGGGSDDGATGATTDGGTLVYATGDAEPTCLDPHVGGNYPQALISTQYLEPLVGRDADGTILPWLATAWTVSDDGLTWDFTLADGISFTDGTPFDAAAVQANVAHVQDPDTGSSTGYLALAKVASVEVVDATHARFHLSEPDSALLESLSQQWVAMESPAGIARGTDANCAAPIGTGPFVVQEWVAQQQVELVRNEDYTTVAPEAEHEGVAYLDRIVWRFLPDAATRYAALRSGEVQVIDNPQPDTVAAAQADEGGDVQVIDAPRPGSVNRIELNSSQAPFDDERVREAFVRAADVEPGIETLFAGTTTRSTSPLSSVEPLAYSEPDLFTTDVDAANALLDEAGWTGRDSEGYRTKDGVRLTVRMPVSTNQSVAAEQSLFEQIQATTAEVGFDLVLTPMDLSAWYAALGAHEYEAVSAPYTKVGPDVLRILYHSDGTVPAPSGYFANHAGVTDPALDALLDQASATSDDAERADLYQQAQQIVLEGYYILPLYDQQNIFLTSGVEGVRTLHTVSTPTFLDARLAS